MRSVRWVSFHKRQMADNIKDSLKAESEQQKQEYQTKLQERREAARTEYLKELEKNYYRSICRYE